MKKIFDEISLKTSILTTKTYSTSFTLGIKTIDKNIQNEIYSIYGFVRFADEIVDTFHGFNKKKLLDKFKKDTHESIKNKISLNPILNSFQRVVNKYKIDIELVDCFLESMEMDLNKQEYNQAKYKKYILGSAQVVGLMCLKVFDKDKYTKLKPYAMSLGAAFQKINFLRDLGSDYTNLGRTYFPNVNLENFTNIDKLEIENNIKKDFDHALIGIKKLPKSSQKGVYLSYLYYLELFNKVKKINSKNLLKKRFRISNFKKILILVKVIIFDFFKII
ncbi:MAG: phytoene synthase [Flavobacteriales bacterium]|nr:phytoene synthase [Flavobacteriales bacterium]|tara:strand:+ start:265 stop:1092 length:828 start_codon:yes stop_codon:yes gene_type:complete